MLYAVAMPWWAFLYLLVFVALTIWGYLDDWRRPNRVFFIAGETISAIFVVFCVVAYFDEIFGEYVGPWILLVASVGMVFEFIALQRVIGDSEHDDELSDKVNKRLDDAGVILVGIFILPGYVCGIVIGLRTIGV